MGFSFCGIDRLALNLNMLKNGGRKVCNPTWERWLQHKILWIPCWMLGTNLLSLISSPLDAVAVKLSIPRYDMHNHVDIDVVLVNRLFSWEIADGYHFFGSYVNWQRWTHMYSFFKWIMRSTNPCVIASMSMFYLSSGFIEGLMAGYAALAVLMPRLVSLFINFCWLTVNSWSEFYNCFSFSIFCS